MKRFYILFIILLVLQVFASGENFDKNLKKQLQKLDEYIRKNKKNIENIEVNLKNHEAAVKNHREKIKFLKEQVENLDEKLLILKKLLEKNTEILEKIDLPVMSRQKGLEERAAFMKERKKTVKKRNKVLMDLRRIEHNLSVKLRERKQSFYKLSRYVKRVQVMIEVIYDYVKDLYKDKKLREKGFEYLKKLLEKRQKEIDKRDLMIKESEVR